MHAFVFGFNHKTCPVALRERVAVATSQLAETCRELRAHTGLNEVAMVSTCNRSEIYGFAATQAMPRVKQWLAERGGFSQRELDTFCYEWHHLDAIRHLYEVSVGLDSLVLGEPQILGQVKDAWRAAQDAGTLGSSLNRLFQQCFTLAKQVRTDTNIGANPVSVAFAAVRLAECQFADISDSQFLLIGAGDTVELAAQHITRRRPKQIIFANRTIEHAVTLAHRHGGFGIGLDDIPQHLYEADVVLSATASSQPVVCIDWVKTALKQRRYRPMLFLDLAVPRDIAPAIHDLPDAYVHTVDDLQAFLDDNRQSREVAAQQAQSIIDLHVERFDAWLQARDRMQLIGDIRGHALNQRDELLERARHMICTGQSAEDALQWLAHSLTQRLLHQPSSSIRDAAMHGDLSMLDAARRLFLPAAPKISHVHNKNNDDETKYSDQT